MEIPFVAAGTDPAHQPIEWFSEIGKGSIAQDPKNKSNPLSSPFSFR